MSKHTNTLGKNDRVLTRPDRPEDYHCTCNLCSNFLGEIYDTENDKYYSNRIRKGYYVDSAGEHLDVGQVIGYRYAVQNFCPEFGFVFDPTVGSGTAIVEAINNGANAVGIELEYPDIADKNVDAQYSDQWNLFQGIGVVIPGNALYTDSLLESRLYTKPWFDLIVNGTPYPTKGGKSSDAPERDNFGKEKICTFDYEHPDNIGKAKEGGEWEDLIRTMYNQSLEYLKPGGYFIIIIKDLMRDKKPYLLHKVIADIVLEDNLGLEPHGYFLHKHVPTTMFMNTYPKRYPEIKIPMYQTGIVLKKMA